MPVLPRSGLELLAKHQELQAVVDSQRASRGNTIADCAVDLAVQANFDLALEPRDGSVLGTVDALVKERRILLEVKWAAPGDVLVELGDQGGLNRGAAGGELGGVDGGRGGDGAEDRHGFGEGGLQVAGDLGGVGGGVVRSGAERGNQEESSW